MSSAALRIDRIEAWTQRRDERGRREWRQRMIASAMGHVVFAALLIWAPSPAPSPLPSVITVDLVAAAPRAASKPAPVPKRAKPPPPTAKPAAAPAPVQKKKVLPTEAPRAAAKPAPTAPPRPAEPELDYDDALSRLRNDAGETTPAPEAEEVVDAVPASGSAGQLNPELAAWQTAVDRRLKQTWVVPAEFRDISLRTLLSARIMADGTVLGSPLVKRSSGNPSYDDNAVRAVIQASPLPPPPRAGEWPIWFDG